MKLSTELNEDVQYVSESKEDGKKNYYIEGIFMQGDIKNRNGRMYPAEVLDKEVKRYNKEYVEKNRAYGELGHPSGPTINLERVSHLITDLKRDGANFKGRAKILAETPMGAIVKGIMDDGGQLAVSSRGMGSLKQNRQGVNEVQGDFYLDVKNPKLFKKVRKFYDDMKSGLAKPEDFERYIYGGNYDRKFFHDDRDAVEDKVRAQIRKWDEEEAENIKRATRKA